ncbi:Adiponectin receptor protein [Trichoderma lentiforme]|uniref:Adiponectin receptor protein n=1 Tax=Trichoderma lentiforme TaxID=1567552 RepID=A0A9P4XRW2_9HYPO|nr:Adiponectin receptor protein [Trichoderma lentiforme]
MSLRRGTLESVSQLSMETNPLMKQNKADHLLLRVPRLLYFHEIPKWQQDNEFLLSGYRPTSGSTWISYNGILYLHNQTINIYSHLVGCIVFCILPFYFYWIYYQSQANAQVDDVVVISIYCLGVAVCFAFSATLVELFRPSIHVVANHFSRFHILWNHSQALTSFWNKLDYLGILVLMWGAGIPTIYYGFFCNQNLQRFYWMTTSGTALGCAIVTLHPRFISPQFRHWRACFYGGFGLSSIIFVVHGLILHGWELQKAHMSLNWMGWMATSNLTGAIIYAARVPERWVPHKFDIFGASHQILHVAVIIAAVIHFYGLLNAFSIIRSKVDTCVN